MTTARKTLSSAFPVLVLLAVCMRTAVAQAQPVANDERIARIYDLQQLLERTRTDATGPALAMPEPEHKRDPVVAQKPALDSVATLVRAFVQPGLAANEAVQTLGERWLVVLGRAEQHAWVDRFLQSAHEDRPLVGRMRVEVVTLPEALFLRDVAPALAQDDKPPSEVTVLQPGAATTAFLDQLRAHPKATAVPVPAPEAGVALQALVPCSVAAISQTAYVRDFKIEVTPRAFVADPVVDVVQDGFTLRATAQPGKAGLGLALNAVWADLTRPIPTFTTTLGIGRPVTIQLPHVQQVQIEAAVELPADNAVVLVLPALLGKRCIAVLHVEPVAGDRPKATGR